MDVEEWPVLEIEEQVLAPCLGAFEWVLVDGRSAIIEPTLG